MNYKLLMDTALLVGEIMLTGGAETYRVEDTMCRILRLSQLERTEAFVIATGIMATIDDPKIDAISLLKRVEKRVTNLNNIYLANDISRRLCSGEIELKDANVELKKIGSIQQYPDKVIWFFTILSTSFFSVLLGGNMQDCGLAAVNGCFIVLCTAAFKKIKVNDFIVNMASSILVAVSTTAFVSIFGSQFINSEIVITGSIVPLLPGVAITNAIRDTLQGDYTSGAARAIESFVVAASIAVGIGVGLGLFSFLEGFV